MGHIVQSSYEFIDVSMFRLLQFVTEFFEERIVVDVNALIKLLVV